MSDCIENLKDKMKHTPAPWVVDLKNLNSMIDNHVPINSTSHAGFAQIVWQMEDDVIFNKPSPQCQANAQLICAAPEMLNALMIADKFFGQLTSDECPDSVHITIRDAIKKATG